MFKSMVTLIRGQAAAAEEQFADRNALLMLDQQIRDAQAGHAGLQRALATALAEGAQEGRRREAVAARIVSLEQRVRSALASGQQDLATEVCEAIAGLEMERDAGDQARAGFADEIRRLRRAVAAAGLRIAGLQRGRRTARVAHAVRVSRQGRMEAAPQHRATIAEAEATLSRLREQQVHAATEDAFLDEIDEPASLDERLDAAGCGPATRPTAASVLARIKQA